MAFTFSKINGTEQTNNEINTYTYQYFVGMLSHVIRSDSTYIWQL